MTQKRIWTILINKTKSILAFDPNFWPWHLTQICDPYIWPWHLTLKFDLDIWPWHLSLSYDPDDWHHNRVYDLQIWPKYLIISKCINHNLWFIMNFQEVIIHSLCWKVLNSKIFWQPFLLPVVLEGMISLRFEFCFAFALLFPFCRFEG